VFFLGLLSTPLPYLLLAVFYFFGFATGMFKVNVDGETNTPIQVKNIQVEPQSDRVEKSGNTFQFHEYKFDFQKKVAYCAIPSIEPPPVGKNEQINYFLHDIKIHHSSISEYSFCRPPPTRS
jgi:hypothetical protein